MECADEWPGAFASCESRIRSAEADAEPAAAGRQLHQPGAMACALRGGNHHYEREPRSLYAKPTASAARRKPDGEFWFHDSRDDLDERRRELPAVPGPGQC